MTSIPQQSIRLTMLAGLSLALALGACSSNSSSGNGNGGSPGNGGVVGSGGVVSAGGTVAPGGSTATPTAARLAGAGSAMTCGPPSGPSARRTGRTSMHTSAATCARSRR